MDCDGQLFLVQGAGSEPIKGYDRRTREPQPRTSAILLALDQPRRQRQEAADIGEIAL